MFKGAADTATGVKLVPLNRSWSMQCRVPGMCPQLVHCQNRQPLDPQFRPGTRGAEARVQWASQSGEPASANLGVSAIAVVQKCGDE